MMVIGSGDDGDSGNDGDDISSDSDNSHLLTTSCGQCVCQAVSL
jgi:hypothetical protein